VSDFLKNLRGKKPEDNNNEDDNKQPNMAGKILETVGNDALVMRGDDLATQRKSNASLKVNKKTLIFIMLDAAFNLLEFKLT
jgi:hypothetical protein